MLPEEGLFNVNVMLKCLYAFTRTTNKQFEINEFGVGKDSTVSKYDNKLCNNVIVENEDAILA